MIKKDLEKFRQKVQYMDALIERLEESIIYDEYDPCAGVELNALMFEVANETMEIIDRIYKIESSISRVLLIQRFILRYDNFEISYRLDYSYNYISKVMTKAIIELSCRYPLKLSW